MERRLGLAFTTLTIFAPFAQAAHSQQAIRPEGTARPYELVATVPDPRGVVLARQVLSARAGVRSADSATPATTRAQSRVIYLNHRGAQLRPGDHDSARQISSIVNEATQTGAWDVDDNAWQATVDCVANMYARFDVTVTDQDPGSVPHIEALIGGHPSDVGLADNVAGISPFTTDCAIIERAIIFTFPDVPARRHPGGVRGSSSGSDDTNDDSGPSIRSAPIGGCSAAGGSTGMAMALAMLGLYLRRRR